MSAVRVAHLIPHPVEYYVPLYRALASRPEVELTVFYLSDISTDTFYDPEFGRAIDIGIPLLDGYDYRFLPSARRASIRGGLVRWPSWDVVWEVAFGPYDVIWAHGYWDSTTWATTFLARPLGTRLLLRDAQNLIQPRSRWRTLLKRVGLPLLYSQAFGAYVGEQARRYFLHYGMPKERLFAAWHCVDNRFFQDEAARLAPQREQIRRSFGIDDDAPTILFCGKLITAKLPLVLTEAFARVRAEQRCWLLFAGDGAERDAVAALVDRLGIPSVRLAGYLDQAELPRAYVAADVFCLPSAMEVWGMVVNEAMNFSLPLVLSDTVGAAKDLVKPGWNGCVCPTGDVTSLAAALRRLVVDAELRSQWGANSRVLVDRYSVERCADGLVEAALAAAGRSEAHETRSTGGESAEVV